MARETFKVILTGKYSYNMEEDCGAGRCEMPATFSIYGPQNCHMCGNEIHFCEAHFLEFKKLIAVMDTGGIDIDSGHESD